MAETIRVEGLRELGAAFRELSDDMQKKVAHAAVAAAAQVIKKRAVINVKTSPSVVTGSLRDAIITKRLPASQTPLTSEYIVTVRGRGKTNKKTGVKQKEAPHAHFIEFGTVHAPAEPFLRPALDVGKNEAIDAMKNRLKARIDKANRA